MTSWQIIDCTALEILIEIRAAKKSRNDSNAYGDTG